MKTYTCAFCGYTHNNASHVQPDGQGSLECKDSSACVHRYDFGYRTSEEEGIDTVGEMKKWLSDNPFKVSFTVADLPKYKK